MNTRQYALSVVIAPLLCLGAITVFNYHVDPYQIFSADRAAIYRNKPALHANMRMHKAYQVTIQKPDSLILGTSKAIQGIPTQHTFFNAKRVYNIAVPLASMKELSYLLRHAQANQRLQSVVLALDFLSFNTRARTDGPAAGFQPARLDGHSKSTRYHWLDYLSALTSSDALAASFESIKASRSESKNRNEHRVLTGLGGRQDTEIRSRLTDGGHRSNTVKIEEFFTNAVFLPAPHREFSFSTPSEDSFYWYEQFLRTVYQQNISAELLISPSHARLNELIYQAGLWPQFEQWKRRLLAINQIVAAQFGKDAIILWDFSMPGPITTEPFPDAGDTQTQMKYYYEAIHFNQHTGSLILDRLSSKRSDFTDKSVEPFGIKLEADNLEKILLTTSLRQADFRKRFPEYVSELKQITDRNTE